jgi:phosphopantothenoylcysteine decarboxylase/phosphopantothenate--cysteine ligase
VTLLLGPTPLTPESSQVRVERFRTTADLAGLLERHFPECDVLVMAAAVADYRLKPVAGQPDAAEGKLKRSEGPLSLELEPTPDLLAWCGQRRHPGQYLVGFALEPRSRLLESARAKITRKSVDMIVANPLETMDAPTIEATLVGPSGILDSTGTAIPKPAFAAWLLNQIERRANASARPALETPSP